MIPAYQKHNVLKALTKNLVQNRSGSRSNAPDTLSEPHGTGAKLEGKRQAVAQKVTAVVLEKINNIRSRRDRGLKTAADHALGKGISPDPPGDMDSRFTYMSLDENGRKYTLTRVVKDADLIDGPSVSDKGSGLDMQ